MIEIKNYKDMEPFVPEGRPWISKRVVIGKAQGNPSFAMRVFEIHPGHTSKSHGHWWEHGVYIISGSGAIKTEDGRELPFLKGDVLYIPQEEHHQVCNTGTEVLSFICVIPGNAEELD